MKDVNQTEKVLEKKKKNFHPAASQAVCAGCGLPIQERFLLKAVEMYWHEDCLKCSCCDCRLGEMGSTCYTKANLILCRRDYLRMFGATGECAACQKTIPAFEMVMRAKNNVYHLDCFACQQCNHRFCVGDRFYLLDNRILCEYDHAEPSPKKHRNSGSAKPLLDDNNDDASSGYGSPDSVILDGA